jgi:hypothetical protein
MPRHRPLRKFGVSGVGGCKKAHLFLSVPYVCPEPVLVKKVTTKLPPPFSVCKSVQAYPVLMIVGRSDESSSKASN